MKIDENSLPVKGSYGKVYEGKYAGVLKKIKKSSDESSKVRLIEREMKHHIKLDDDNLLKLQQILPSDDDCLYRKTQIFINFCSN